MLRVIGAYAFKITDFDFQKICQIINFAKNPITYTVYKLEFLSYVPLQLHKTTLSWPPIPLNIAPSFSVLLTS